MNLLLALVVVFASSFESPDYVVGHLDAQSGWETKSNESYFDQYYPFSVATAEGHGQVIQINSKAGGPQRGSLTGVAAANLGTQLTLHFELYIDSTWNRLPTGSSADATVTLVAGTRLYPFGFTKSADKEGWQVGSTFVAQSMPVGTWVPVDILANSVTRKMRATVNGTLIAEVTCDSWGSTKIWGLQLSANRTIDNKFTDVLTYIDNLQLSSGP